MSGVLLPLSLFGAAMLLLAASAVLTFPRLTTAQAALAEQQAATGARAEHQAETDRAVTQQTAVVATLRDQIARTNAVLLESADKLVEMQQTVNARDATIADLRRAIKQAP